VCVCVCIEQLRNYHFPNPDFAPWNQMHMKRLKTGPKLMSRVNNIFFPDGQAGPRYTAILYCHGIRHRPIPYKKGPWGIPTVAMLNLGPECVINESVSGN
jgi:hypothetical protein